VWCSDEKVVSVPFGCEPPSFVIGHIAKEIVSFDALEYAVLDSLGPKHMAGSFQIERIEAFLHGVKDVAVDIANLDSS
jgi:hypothetical protein